MKRSMNEKQKYALYCVQNGHNIYLGGCAGTGKSFVVKEIVNMATSSGKDVAVTCTTGVACSVYQEIFMSMTIHKWCGIGDGRLTLQQLTGLTGDDRYTSAVERIKTVDILILDEISMLSKNESVYINTLDKPDVKKARDELGEDEEQIDSCVQTFRELVKHQTWINTPLGTRFLLTFLRTQKYNQSLAKKRLENFFTMREENPKWFGNKDPNEDKIQDLLKTGFFIRLPRLDNQGRVVILSRPGHLNVKQVKEEFGGSDTAFRAFMTVLDWLLMDERAQVNGILFIIDQTGFTLEHKLDVYNFDNIKRVFAALQDSYPFRVKEFHFYNSPQLFEAMFTLIKNFLEPKLRERITIHGKNIANLYEKVDMRVLPDEYLPDEYTGPSSGSLQTIIDNMRKEITESSVSDYIKALSTNYGIDLKQRPNDADQQTRSPTK